MGALWQTRGGGHVPDEIVLNGVLYIRADGRSEDWLTVKEAAQLSGRDVHTVYGAIKSGELDARVPNGLTKGMRVRRGDLMAWMAGKSAAHAEG